MALSSRMALVERRQHLRIADFLGMSAMRLLLVTAMDEPNAEALIECANCLGLHRRLMHAGRKLLCLMASCGCTGFVAKAEEPEQVETPA